MKDATTTTMVQTEPDDRSGEDGSNTRRLVRVSVQSLHRAVVDFGTMIAYEEEPQTVICAWDAEEDAARREDQLYEIEAAVRPEVDAAIGVLCAQRKWPPQRSSVAWAASRRVDWLAGHLRLLSTWPSLHAVDLRVESHATIASFCVELLTVFYTRQRGLLERPAGFHMGGHRGS